MVRRDVSDLSLSRQCEILSISRSSLYYRLRGESPANLALMRRIDELFQSSVHQEDCCQALSVPPTRKYQSDGGPGLVDVLTLLKGSDTPAEDQRKVLQAQLLFWLIGATDGHAKNFSIFLGPGEHFSLTPLYDVLTAQPSLDARQIERKQMRLAMSVGSKRHYKFDEVHARHFLQTAYEAGLPKTAVQATIEEIAEAAPGAIERVEASLPAGFPEDIHVSVKTALLARLQGLRLPEA